MPKLTVEAVETAEGRVSAAIPMVELIVKMARDDVPNAVEAGRALERIADQAVSVIAMLEHGRKGRDIELHVIPTGAGGDDAAGDP